MKTIKQWQTQGQALRGMKRGQVMVAVGTGKTMWHNDKKWTDWHRTVSFIPRRSNLSGKLIFGWINKSSRTEYNNRGGGVIIQVPTRVRRYATDKELFQAKLRGTA